MVVAIGERDWTGRLCMTSNRVNGTMMRVPLPGVWCRWLEHPKQQSSGVNFAKDYETDDSERGRTTGVQDKEMRHLARKFVDVLFHGQNHEASHPLPASKWMCQMVDPKRCLDGETAESQVRSALRELVCHTSF